MTSLKETANTPPGLKESLIFTLFKFTLVLITLVSLSGIFLARNIWPDDINFYYKETLFLITNIIIDLSSLIPIIFIAYLYGKSKQENNLSFIGAGQNKFNKICNSTSFFLLLPWIIGIAKLAVDLFIDINEIPTYIDDIFQDLLMPLCSSVFIPFVLSLLIQLLKLVSDSCFFKIIAAHHMWFEARWFPDHDREMYEINSKHQENSNEKDAPKSVADELLKWTDLRDKGIITEKEYQKIRKNLLKII